MPESGALVPYDLRCEYCTNPLGIDVRRPRLTWKLKGRGRGRKQTSFRIMVATSPALLKQGRGDLWDTGQSTTSDAMLIHYQGRILVSRQRAYWRVGVWDEKKEGPSWSAIASWSAGLLQAEDWQASWIGYDAPLAAARRRPVKNGRGNPVVVPPPRCLRREFKTDRAVTRATLYSSALGNYEMFINGTRVGDEFFKPGWTDYNTRIQYWTHDVTAQVRRGGNALAALLADGWYAGHVGFGGKRDHYGTSPRLLAQLHLTYRDGSQEVIVSDRTWKAATGPLLEADFLMGETYDARLELSGWDSPGFNDRGWKKVTVVPAPDALLEARRSVPVRVYRTIRPTEVTAPRKGVYVFNMGTNFAGILRLTIKARRGTRITLQTGERLNPDGTVYTVNLRSARAADTYICRGGGVETWHPYFTFHGFQYVEVTGLSGQPSKTLIAGLELTSAVPVAGRFRCNDRTANRLYANICQTQRSNFIDIPTDCPQRDERLGWTGDAQIYIRTAAFNNDITAFFTKWLVDLEDAQGPEGDFPDVAPRKVATGGGTAAWGDAGVICPWTMYQVYGDKTYLAHHYRSMTKWIAYCRKNSRALIRPASGYGDWLSINADTPKDLLATAYFAHSTRLVSEAAKVLGKRSDAVRYADLFERIRVIFNRVFVSCHGRLKGDTQTAYVLALAFDLLDADKQAIAVDHLVQNIEERGCHLSTGFVGTKDLMGVLDRVGRNDIAYRLFHNDTFPSWGFSIKHGATSIWERWNGWTPEHGFGDPGMNSFAHYAFGAVGEWMFKVIGGIDSEGPGFEKIIIRPRPGGRVHSATVTHTCVRGLIRTAWKQTDREFRLAVTIPPSTIATVYLPADTARDIAEGGRPLAKAVGVNLLKSSSGETVFEIGSGDYVFTVKRR